MNDVSKKYFKKPKDFLVLFVGLFGFVYVINPTAGLFEFIPDVIPFVGNLDEAGALFLIYSSLEYFGINIKSLFKRN